MCGYSHINTFPLLKTLITAICFPILTTQYDAIVIPLQYASFCSCIVHPIIHYTT